LRRDLSHAVAAAQDLLPTIIEPFYHLASQSENEEAFNLEKCTETDRMAQYHTRQLILGLEE
jgi:hypothetical protein